MPGTRSVVRALELLRIVAKSPAPVRFTDLVVATGLPKASLHGLLGALESERFVVRVADGYRIGIAAFEVGTAIQAPASLRQAAGPWLDRLAGAAGEACHLGLLDEGDVVYVDRRDAAGEGLRFTVRIGQRLPAYGTALGKAMLAQLTDQQVARLYPERLPAITDRTLASRDELIDVLARIREVGFAQESEESTPGVRCVGVGLRTPVGVVGLSITAPVHRATFDDLESHLPLLRQAVAEVRETATAGSWLAARPARAPAS